MHKMLSAIVIFAFMTSAASAACNYSNDYATNCSDALTDYLQKTVNYQSSSYKDIEKRVDTLKGTLNECAKCAWQHINNGVNSSSAQ